MDRPESRTRRAPSSQGDDTDDGNIDGTTFSLQEKCALEGDCLELYRRFQSLLKATTENAVDGIGDEKRALHTRQEEGASTARQRRFRETVRMLYEHKQQHHPTVRYRLTLNKFADQSPTFIISTDMNLSPDDENRIFVPLDDEDDIRRRSLSYPTEKDLPLEGKI